MKHVKLLTIAGLMSGLLFLTNCGNDDAPPPEENPEETIDRVTLTFFSVGSDNIVVTATDPDGEGDADFTPDGEITLNTNSSYSLFIQLENTATDENISDEVRTEAEEHMFFFEFTTGIFSDPLGNGNVDSRDNTVDDVLYADFDDDDLPLGLTTEWFTPATETTGGTFRIVLKHQPDVKSETSQVGDGETDVDVSWTINITN